MNLEDFYNQLTKVLFRVVNKGEVPSNVKLIMKKDNGETTLYFVGDTYGSMIRWKEDNHNGED